MKRHGVRVNDLHALIKPDLAKYAVDPVVISQVFNLDDADVLSDSRKAIHVLPPMDKQLAAWLEIDPNIRNVGAVLGPGHEALLAETNEAAQALGIKFHYAIAESDRETLYLFDRLVRDIDGYLLFPDNRILSRSVLSDMLGIAARQRVQVAVFNEPLLDLGATFSASATEVDIAETIIRALNEIMDGNLDGVPSVTPLNDVRITTNPAALRRFGLLPDEAQQNTVADVP